jgi:uncharacterized delta-60 repeat protein
MARHYILLSTLFGFAAHAQTLDATFGTGGVVLADAGNSDIIRDIALQTDGKIVAAGWSYDATTTDLLVARFNANGTLDNTFSGDGVVVLPTGLGFSGAEAVAVQDNGMILVAGYSNNGATNGFTVWRFQSNGTLDPGFGNSGIYTNILTPDGSFITGMRIQSDGRIVVTGPVYSGATPGAGVMRLTTTGALDNTFDGTGYHLVAEFAAQKDYFPNCIALRTDGKIIVAGTYKDHIGGTMTQDALCAQLNINGTMDDTFGTSGVAVVQVPDYEEYVQAIAVQDDGRIMMTGDGQSTGASDWNILLERLGEDGTPDPTLGTNAILWNPSGNAEYSRGLNIQSNGKYLIAGSSAGFSGTEAFAVRCLAANAMGDNSFGNTGYQSADFGDYTYAEAALLQPDGKYLIAGNSASGGLPYDMFLARYDVGEPTGIDALAVGSDDLCAYPLPAHEFVTIANNGDATVRRIEMHDAAGRTVLTERIPLSPGATLTIDLHDVPAGMYLLCCISNNASETLRIAVE